MNKKTFLAQAEDFMEQAEYEKALDMACRAARTEAAGDGDYQADLVGLLEELSEYLDDPRIKTTLDKLVRDACMDRMAELFKAAGGEMPVREVLAEMVVMAQYVPEETEEALKILIEDHKIGKKVRREILERELPYHKALFHARAGRQDLRDFFMEVAKRNGHSEAAKTIIRAPAPVYKM